MGAKLCCSGSPISITTPTQQALHVHATEENDRSMLNDALCMLSKTRSCIQNSMSTHDRVKSMVPRLANFLKTPLSGSVLSMEAKNKLDDLIQSISRSQSSSDRPILVSEFIMGMSSIDFWMFLSNCVCTGECKD